LEKTFLIIFILVKNPTWGKGSFKKEKGGGRRLFPLKLFKVGVKEG